MDAAPVLNVVIPTINYAPLLPFIIVFVTGLVALVLDPLLPQVRHSLIAWISLVGLGLAFIDCVTLFGGTNAAFGGTYIADNFGMFFSFILLCASAATILLAVRYPSRVSLNEGDFYGLILFCTAGMLLVVQASDFVILIIGIETLSIALYVMAGYTRNRIQSDEAALKYFLMGAFAFGFLLYGTALIYGSAGSTQYAAVAKALGAEAGTGLYNLAVVGMGLLMVGFGFELAFVPFHQWTPDVYDGAPAPVTAFMSVATKVAVFAGLIRVLEMALSPLTADWFSVLWALSVLTMVVGNVIAVVQTNIKRMLAYSSIAQAGYVLIGVLAAGPDGQQSVMFYLAAYMLMNFGAFAVVAALSRGDTEALDLNDYAGLSKRAPFMAAVMLICMLSLAGIPLTGGFVGKLYIFVAAIEAGHPELVVIAVLASAVSAFYYLRVVYYMYFRSPASDVGAVPAIGREVLVLVAIAAIGTIFLGVLPWTILGVAHQSVALAVTP